MKYAVQMVSGAMIYIPCFIKIGSGIQKLIWGYTQAYRQYDDLIILILFSQNKENGLKTELSRNPWHYNIFSDVRHERDTCG
jgi:hypothetical protein